MAQIRFKVRGRSNPSALSVRFYHSKVFDCSCSTEILIHPELWDHSNQSINDKFNNNQQTSSDEIVNYSIKIDALKNFILKRYLDSYSKGEIINPEWLRNVVEIHSNKPKTVNDPTKFLCAFIENYIIESENRMNPKTGKRISKRTIQKYSTILNHIKNFEDIKKLKLMLTDVNLNFHRLYTTYLKLELNYSNTLIEKDISTIKGFIKEAKTKGYKTHPEVEHRNFTFQRDQPIDVYLNENEIDKIFNLDLSTNERLDKVRDLFIIGLWTGLRISDLKRINHFKISNESIVISETIKTGANVIIPIHSQVREILNKRSNRLPDIISEQKFNQYVKEVCQLASITEQVLGNIKNKVTNRKEKGYYPKYQLISSHTCRRSFATNHYGKLPNRDIMAITTHKTEAQFMKYIKTTSKEHHDNLAKYWAEQEDVKNGKENLKISY